MLDCGLTSHLSGCDVWEVCVLRLGSESTNTPQLAEDLWSVNGRRGSCGRG